MASPVLALRVLPHFRAVASMTPPMGPQCIRCLLPVHLEGTWAPYCGFPCAEVAAKEAGEAAWEEEMAGRHFEPEMAVWSGK